MARPPDHEWKEHEGSYEKNTTKFFLDKINLQWEHVQTTRPFIRRQRSLFLKITRSIIKRHFMEDLMVFFIKDLVDFSRKTKVNYVSIVGRKWRSRTYTIKKSLEYQCCQVFRTTHRHSPNSVLLPFYYTFPDWDLAALYVYNDIINCVCFNSPFSTYGIYEHKRLLSILG